MIHSLKTFMSLSAYIVLLLLNNSLAKVEQCHIDCNAPSSIRPIGPTRPWHLNDDLGNPLKLTKPYPFSIAGNVVGVLEFNFTMIIENAPTLNFSSKNKNIQPFENFVHVENEVFTDIVRSLLSLDEYISYDLEIIKYPTVEALQVFEESSDKVGEFEFVCSVQINSNHNGFEYNSISTFFTSHVRPTLLNKIDNLTYSELISDLHRGGTYSITQHETLNRTFFIDEDSHQIKDTYSVEYPNPYTEFCELGCSIFFSLPTEQRVELNECTNQCDEKYKYNISVGYNDLAEVARLECRDGCQMALKRCQPGYFCSQVEVTKEKVQDKIKYEGGFMEHCPAGTYRDVDYSSVEQCVPCPPGRFREAIKGRNLKSCAKCPRRTYNPLNGSSSILDCLRCPAGTFTNEVGSAFCICITPAACEQDQLPSPADAEKRNTVPYIGRW